VKANVGDIELGYDDIGRGVPVVLVHGFPHDRTLWAPQLRALASDYRCVAPDLRGFGESGVAPPYSMDQYADDLVRLFDALRMEPAVVGGISMGGYVTFALWRRHRRRVRAMILLDTRAGADTEEGRAKRRDMIATARERGSAAVADAMMGAMLGKTTREQQPQIAESMRAMMAAAPVEGVIGALEALVSRPDSSATLATIDVPTLIVVGEEDTLTPRSESEALHAAIAGSVLQTIPAAGHVSNVEQPAAVNQVLVDFLRGVVSRP
jgi:3-oxoadipate enol-lactonase